MVTDDERRLLKENRSEMTESEIDFLYKLLDNNRPKKIVEVGVAAGGTTAAILEHIGNYDYECTMYSIDKSPKYYRDESLDTGFLAKKYLAKTSRDYNHEFLLGKYAPEFLDYLNGNIDFLILDTVHSLPGELLDFIAFLPHLKNDAVVVLHDTCLNHSSHNSAGYATQLLLDTVSGEKYFDLFIDGGVPNIGAFKVTDETKKNIEDVFRALLITWNYKLDSKQINLYKTEYSKYYNERNMQLFEMAIVLNETTYCESKKRKRIEFINAINFIERIVGRNVYIYGAGFFGKKIFEFLQEFEIHVKGFIVSDDKDMPDISGVISLSEYVRNKKNDDIIIIGVSENITDEIEKNLGIVGLHNYLKMPKMIFEVM